MTLLHEQIRILSEESDHSNHFFLPYDYLLCIPDCSLVRTKDVAADNTDIQ